MRVDVPMNKRANVHSNMLCARTPAANGLNLRRVGNGM
jgi:hypothetical protein